MHNAAAVFNANNTILTSGVGLCSPPSHFLKRLKRGWMFFPKLLLRWYSM